MNKRAQFFLLAAVIISVVVISFGFSENWAKVNEEPDSFYDFSYEVQRETGEVLDYEIYTNFVPGADLDSFVALFAEKIKDSNPDADFLFVYGDEDGMKVSNYGKGEVEISVPMEVVGLIDKASKKVEGKLEKVPSKIVLNDYGQEIEEYAYTFNNAVGEDFLSRDFLAGESNVIVNVKGKDFSVPVSKYRQVVFIIQKDVGDEKFVSAR